MQLFSCSPSTALAAAGLALVGGAHGAPVAPSSAGPGAAAAPLPMPWTGGGSCLPNAVRISAAERRGFQLVDAEQVGATRGFYLESCAIVGCHSRVPCAAGEVAGPDGATLRGRDGSPIRCQVLQRCDPRFSAPCVDFDRCRVPAADGPALAPAADAPAEAAGAKAAGGLGRPGLGDEVPAFARGVGAHAGDGGGAGADQVEVGQQRCCRRKVDGCECLSDKEGDCSGCDMDTAVADEGLGY